MSKAKALEPEEVLRLLRAARDRRHKNAARDYAFLATVVGAGLRVSEAIELRVCDLHLEGKVPSITVTTLKRRRPSRDEVDIHPELAQVLRRFARNKGQRTRLFDFTARSGQRVFSRYAELAGLEGFSIKALRHTAGTLWYEASEGNLKAVANRLRHRKTATAEIYVHISPRRRRETLERLPVLL